VAGVRTVRCCVAGGGPAGMMLGLLLARAGVSVLVLERHADFLRDFRSDTIHPSTLELMRELGMLEEFPPGGGGDPARAHPLPRPPGRGQRSPVAVYSTSVTMPVVSYWMTRIWR
jgi:choline dehydrogenase-like flavoprotein